jgi:Double zinc ribbon
MTVPCLHLQFHWGKIRMEIKKGEAGLRAASNEVLELELYDDLVAFSALNPEEQKLLADQAGPHAGEISYPELFRVEESFFEPDVEPPPVQANDSVVEVLDLAPLNMSAPAAPEDEPSPEPVHSPPVINSAPRGGLSNTSPLEDIWSGATIKSAALASCPACGHRSDAGDLFCIECGEFLDSADMVKVAAVCVECDSIIGNDDIFCSSCGSIISVG